MAYASRSVTATECRYAQIEKECLELAFGCEKSHPYIYGHQQTINHCSKENLCDISPWIQLLYDYELTYVPGTRLFIVDMLSRDASCDPRHNESGEDVAPHVDMAYAAFPSIQEQLSQTATETLKDPVLKKMMRNLQQGREAEGVL